MRLGLEVKSKSGSEAVRKLESWQRLVRIGVRVLRPHARDYSPYGNGFRGTAS